MDTTPEHVRCRQWREGLKLSRPKLAELTGYSVESIVDFEAGARRGTGAPLDPGALRRFKLCCAAVACGLTFDWGKVTIELD